MSTLIITHVHQCQNLGTVLSHGTQSQDFILGTLNQVARFCFRVVILPKELRSVRLTFQGRLELATDDIAAVWLF